MNNEFAKTLASSIKSFISRKIDLLVKKINDIEDELKEIKSFKPENGKNALDLEILPSIDFVKSYDRNTYAAHNGGLWKSFQKTSGERGWECLVNGIKDVDINIEDFRNITISITKSDGTKEDKNFNIPVVLDRGVFSSEKTYEVGDSVSYGGSSWIAQANTTEKPGSSGDWRLSVKKGSSGKGSREAVKLPEKVRI